MKCFCSGKADLPARAFRLGLRGERCLGISQDRLGRSSGFFSLSNLSSLLSLYSLSGWVIWVLGPCSVVTLDGGVLAPSVISSVNTELDLCWRQNSSNSAGDILFERTIFCNVSSVCAQNGHCNEGTSAIRSQASSSACCESLCD